MTEVDRERIVEHMFPNWREHLNDGKVIDSILGGLSSREIVLNKCSRPGCHNVARPGLKTCASCAIKAARYMRQYSRRKRQNSITRTAQFSHPGAAQDDPPAEASPPLAKTRGLKSQSGVSEAGYAVA